MGGQMESLHLAMMRALWIWRTHEMRLMASCNQVARLADLPGHLGQERFQGGAHTCVSFENGRGDDGGSAFRALLALGDGGRFAHQTSGLHTERGGNLNVDELIGVLDTSFGDSHVHSRSVFGVDGRVVHKDFVICT